MNRFVILFLVAGCLQPVGSGPKKPKPTPPAVSGIQALTKSATISALNAEADAIDKIAEDIEKGVIKYDGPLSDRLKEAVATGQKTPESIELGKAMLKALTPSEPTFKPENVAPALRQYAAGKRIK
jgi:hypothetical protein